MIVWLFCANCSASENAERRAQQLVAASYSFLVAYIVSQNFGVVSQDTYLWHSSIRDNLLYAFPDANDGELFAWLGAEDGELAGCGLEPGLAGQALHDLTG